MTGNANHWRCRGVRIVRGDRLDSDPPQTSGRHREAPISRAPAGADRIRVGTEQPLSCVVVRSDQELAVIDLDLPAVETTPTRFPGRPAPPATVNCLTARAAVGAGAFGDRRCRRPARNLIGTGPSTPELRDWRSL